MITNDKMIDQPAYVYLPLTTKKYSTATTIVNKNDSVRIGDIIAYQSNDEDKYPVISTVSGIIIGFEHRFDRFDQSIKHVIIKNDFKSVLKDYKPYPNDVTKSQIITRLRAFHIETISYDGYYTPLALDEKKDHIIVNTIFVNEPFVTVKNHRITEYAKMIIDGIDLLATVWNITSKTILISQNMIDILSPFISACEKKSVMVQYIDLRKMNGWQYQTVRNITSQQSMERVVWTDTEALIYVNQAVRKGLPPTMRRVILTGDGITTNAMCTVRIGTPLSQVIEQIGGYLNIDTISIHIGSYMTGQSVMNDDFIIDLTTHVVHISKYYEYDTEPCIRCGDCNDICPVGILPHSIMEAKKQHDFPMVLKLDVDECIACGLCTYVCPSQINVSQHVTLAKTLGYKRGNHNED